MNESKRKFNVKRALVMTFVFTIVSYIFLIHRPFQETWVNLVAFIIIMSVIDITVLQVLKRRRNAGGEE